MFFIINHDDLIYVLLTGRILRTIQKSFSDHGFSIQEAEAQTCQAVSQRLLRWANITTVTVLYH